MKLSYRLDLSEGSLQYSFSCICMDFYTNIHMHTHACTYTKRRVSDWILPQTGTGRGTKLNGCFWGPREPGFARLSEYLPLCSAGSGDSVASTSGTAFTTGAFHRNTEIEMNNRTKCLMEHALCSELSATLHFSTLPGSQQGSGTLIIKKLKGISNVLGVQSS